MFLDQVIILRISGPARGVIHPRVTGVSLVLGSEKMS